MDDELQGEQADQVARNWDLLALSTKYHQSTGNYESP